VLLQPLIINGSSAVCYDGQYFFDTDHSEGDSGVQANSISVDISGLPTQVHGTVTAPSAEEMELSILQGVNAILGFKDDQGEPMNETAQEFLVMVPVSLFPMAIGAVRNNMLTTNTPNRIATTGFQLSVVANARLSSWTDKFAVFRTDGNVKPFIRQEEVPIQVDAIAEGSELEFNEHKHHYGIWASRNVAYGYWQHACLVTMV